jgi:selenocysteine-specific elongation factor
VRALVGAGVPVVACSARTGTGVEEVRAALRGVAQRVPAGRVPDGPAMLHVDRSFIVHGAGTVVTGTLWSGALSPGDHVVLQPTGRRVRVRSVQVHDAPSERAEAGQRVAANLVGLRVGDVARGDVLVSEGTAIAPAWLLDVALDLGGAAVPARAQVHHGTRETPARIARRDEGRWQLRCERPLIARAGDRFVVRSIAPPGTLGGGLVLDPRARRPRRARRRRRPPRPSPGRCPPPRSPSRRGCARPPTARRATPTWARAPKRRWPSCAPPAARCAWTARRTSTARRSTTSATA